MKPVRPGERGGRYHPFTDQDLEAIVENIYRILEEVGFKDTTPHCIETCEAVGAVMGDDGRLRMPRAVVDTALKHAKRNLTLHAQDPEFDLDLSGSRVHFATAGTAVMIADSINNEYRDSDDVDGRVQRRVNVQQTINDGVKDTKTKCIGGPPTDVL